MKISAAEYRKMIEERKFGVPKNQNPPPPPPRRIIEKAVMTDEEEPEQSGKLTIEEALNQVILFLELDADKVKKARFVIKQLKLSGKL